MNIEERLDLIEAKLDNLVRLVLELKDRMRLLQSSK